MAGVHRVAANRLVRCFGDKGDVEDITEGTATTDRFRSVAHDAQSPPQAHQTNAVTPADIISTVEFDQTGNYLATGDKGGRVVLFERNETVRDSALAVASAR